FPTVGRAPRSCCRLATAKPCSSISTRSQPKSPSERTPLSSLIRPDGMALKPWWFRTTSHSCRCRRAHPNSTARKTSGRSCARICCHTGVSNPSTISSTTDATLGTHSSTNPGGLCPSRDATGQQSITQSEDWYNTAEPPCPCRSGNLHQFKGHNHSLYLSSHFLHGISPPPFCDPGHV